MNIGTLFEFILHVDKYLALIIENYGAAVYFFLFLIIFLETGLVITPFLPGDSLLFVAGAFAAKGVMDITFLFILLVIAAVVGDTLNYWIGNYFGERIFANSRFFKKEYLDKTKEFYHRHGAQTIVLARFVPIVRTFAPFVAGIGKMKYKTFITYNIGGGIAWVALFLFAGYFFGNIPIIEENLTIVIFGIIALSLLPPIIEYYRNKRKVKKLVVSGQ